MLAELSGPHAAQLEGVEASKADPRPLPANNCTITTPSYARRSSFLGENFGHAKKSMCVRERSYVQTTETRRSAQKILGTGVAARHPYRVVAHAITRTSRTRWHYSKQEAALKARPLANYFFAWPKFPPSWFSFFMLFARTFIAFQN